MTKTQFDYFKSQARILVQNAKAKARRIIGAFDKDDSSDLPELLKEKMVVFDVALAIKAIHGTGRRGYIPDANNCVRPANAAASKIIAKREARYEKACAKIDAAFDNLVADAMFQGRKFGPALSLAAFKNTKLDLEILPKV